MFFGFSYEVDYDADDDSEGGNYREDKPYRADNEVFGFGGDSAVT